jgi:hypothetical protein
MYFNQISMVLNHPSELRTTEMTQIEKETASTKIASLVTVPHARAMLKELWRGGPYFRYMPGINQTWFNKHLFGGYGGVSEV